MKSSHDDAVTKRDAVLLVAHYLSRNRCTDALEAFKRESGGLADDYASVAPNLRDLSDILSEYLELKRRETERARFSRALPKKTEMYAEKLWNLLDDYHQCKEGSAGRRKRSTAESSQETRNASTRNAKRRKRRPQRRVLSKRPAAAVANTMEMPTAQQEPLLDLKIDGLINTGFPERIAELANQLHLDPGDSFNPAEQCSLNSDIIDSLQPDIVKSLETLLKDQPLLFDEGESQVSRPRSQHDSLELHSSSGQSGPGNAQEQPTSQEEALTLRAGMASAKSKEDGKTGVGQIQSAGTDREEKAKDKTVKTGGSETQTAEMAAKSSGPDADKSNIGDILSAPIPSASNENKSTAASSFPSESEGVKQNSNDEFPSDDDFLDDVDYDS